MAAGLAVLMLLAAGLAQAAPRRGEILGRWTGASRCTSIAGNEGCHDEKVVYDFIESPGSADKVLLRAAKMVNGRPEPMGELEFAYDEAARWWASEFVAPRAHGLWTFVVTGRKLTGVLYLLPGREIARHVEATRE
jgi:hypothetical protein